MDRELSARANRQSAERYKAGGDGNVRLPGHACRLPGTTIPQRVETPAMMKAFVGSKPRSTGAAAPTRPPLVRAQTSNGVAGQGKR
jgi:hypothetical protein